MKLILAYFVVALLALITGTAYVVANPAVGLVAQSVGPAISILSIALVMFELYRR